LSKELASRDTDAAELRSTIAQQTTKIDALGAGLAKSKREYEELLAKRKIDLAKFAHLQTELAQEKAAKDLEGVAKEEALAQKQAAETKLSEKVEAFEAFVSAMRA